MSNSGRRSAPRSPVTRTSRTDEILKLTMKTRRSISRPGGYNATFAAALRAMADAIEGVDDAYADPEVTVWMHVPGTVTAEVTLAPLAVD